MENVQRDPRCRRRCHNGDGSHRSDRPQARGVGGTWPPAQSSPPLPRPRLRSERRPGTPWAWASGHQGSESPFLRRSARFAVGAPGNRAVAGHMAAPRGPTPALASDPATPGKPSHTEAAPGSNGTQNFQSRVRNRQKRVQAAPRAQRSASRPGFWLHNVFGFCDGVTPAPATGPPFRDVYETEVKSWSGEREGSPCRKSLRTGPAARALRTTPLRTETACSLPRAACTSLLCASQSRARSRCLTNAGCGLLARPRAPEPQTSLHPGRHRVPERPASPHGAPSRARTVVTSSPASLESPGRRPPVSVTSDLGSPGWCQARGPPEPAVPSALPAQAQDARTTSRRLSLWEAGWKFSKGVFFLEK